MDQHKKKRKGDIKDVHVQIEEIIPQIYVKKEIVPDINEHPKTQIFEQLKPVKKLSAWIWRKTATEQGIPSIELIVAENRDEALKLVEVDTGKEITNEKIESIDLFTSGAVVIQMLPISGEKSKPKKEIRVIDTKKLNLYICTDHYSEFPVKPASYVVAENASDATKMLTEKLAIILGSFDRKRNIPFNLLEIDLSYKKIHKITDSDVGGLRQ